MPGEWRDLRHFADRPTEHTLLCLRTRSAIHSRASHLRKIHADHPDGFRRTNSETPNRARRRGSLKNAAGLDEPTDLEHADLAGLIEVGQKRGAKIRWNRSARALGDGEWTDLALKQATVR